jgi:Tol biopolymer transport system component
MVDMTNGETFRLTDQEANDLNPFWSDDGSKIVFQSDRSGIWQIYELDLINSVSRLFSDGTGNDVDPEYSPDGTQIAFRSYRDGENSVIYVADSDGANPTPISDPNGDATNHIWAPDGSIIAYQSDLDGDLDVYVFETASGQTRQLTNNDIDDYAPTWRCSSNELVFTSEISGNPDIYSAPPLPISESPIFVDQDAEQLTFGESDDIYPQNSPTEENASREGRLPSVGDFGQQLSFLPFDASTTDVDLSIDFGEWDEGTINSCPG